MAYENYLSVVCTSRAVEIVVALIVPIVRLLHCGKVTPFRLQRAANQFAKFPITPPTRVGQKGNVPRGAGVRNTRCGARAIHVDHSSRSGGGWERGDGVDRFDSEGPSRGGGRRGAARLSSSSQLTSQGATVN